MLLKLCSRATRRLVLQPFFDQTFLLLRNELSVLEALEQGEMLRPRWADAGDEQLMLAR